MLVYEHDPRDAAKQRKAADLVRRLIEADRAVLSVQSLMEFYRTTTQRLPEPLATSTALDQVGRLVRSCLVLDVTGAVAFEACRGSAVHGLSVWDAVLWATAKMNGVPYVLTEDAEHGRFLEGVTYLDPFDPRFEIAPLLS